MCTKIIAHLLVLAEFEAKSAAIDVDKLKDLLVDIKSLSKDAVQKAIEKINPRSRIDLKDDVVETLKDRKRSCSMNRSSAPSGTKKSLQSQSSETLSIFEEVELIKTLPKAEPIPEDIMELD
mmetsp:Transcript_27614/g.60807  ORF Transcript_27614/g.60807 Transcript_27614/m.60807 type:complete len:122 (+) Transcript_27614:3561-3926(+)